MLHPNRLAIAFATLALGATLSGCVARAAANIVTAPVKVVSSAVDLATTSQSEADEKRGRELRKREEKLGKLDRKYSKLLKRCEEGDRRKCDEARLVYAEMQELQRTLPAPPPDDR